MIENQFIQIKSIINYKIIERYKKIRSDIKTSYFHQEDEIILKGFYFIKI